MELGGEEKQLKKTVAKNHLGLFAQKVGAQKVRPPRFAGVVSVF